MTPTYKMFSQQTGKTIAQFKTELIELINKNSNRPLYVAIRGGSNIALNIDNDEYVIEDGSDIALWITCVHPSGNYAHIEFTSYGFKERYYATMQSGIIKGY